MKEERLIKTRENDTLVTLSKRVFDSHPLSLFVLAIASTMGIKPYLRATIRDKKDSSKYISNEVSKRAVIGLVNDPQKKCPMRCIYGTTKS
jgi:hypothetical protein